MRLPLLVTLSLLRLLQVCSDSLIVYKYTNIECVPDPGWVQNVTCALKAVNWNKAAAQMDCDLINPVSNVSVQIQLFQKNYNNRYNPFLVNVTVNLCDVMSKRNFLSYGTIMWKILKQYTNINHRCPIKGHLSARNLYIDEGYLPSFPIGFYRISFRYIENQNRVSQFVGLVHLYVQVKENERRKKN